MKKIFLFSVAVLLLTSCTQKVSKVHGIVADFVPNGALVYVYDDLLAQEPQVFDSLEIKDGAFSFSLKPDITKLKVIYFPEAEIGIPFIAESGDVTFNFKDVVPSGTPLNEKLKGLLLEYRAIADSLSAISSDLNKKERVAEKISSLFESEFKENKRNVLSAYMLLLYSRFLEHEDFLKYYKMLNEEAQEIESLKQIYSVLEKEVELSVGKSFKDFEGVLPTDTTKVVALSDYVGKGNYVIVDFWASWCGPCIRELPNLKRIYENYNSKGLQIVGVGVWDKTDDNLRAIDKFEITWPQIFDLKRTVIAESYGILSIPTIILFDKEGKIVSKDLRGEMLEQKIKELYE